MANTEAAQRAQSTGRQAIDPFADNVIPPLKAENRGLKPFLAVAYASPGSFMTLNAEGRRAAGLMRREIVGIWDDHFNHTRGRPVHVRTFWCREIPLPVQNFQLRAWVKQALEKTGETPMGLAQRAGLGAGTITRFLNGEWYGLTTRSIEKIAAAADLPPPTAKADGSQEQPGA
jgi:hypothetical protein